MTLRGILWDMDGVLIDTTQAHFEAWRTIAAGYGIQLDRERFLGSMGMNNVGAIETLFGRPTNPQEVLEIGDKKEALFRQLLVGRVKLLPGVPEWLQAFQLLGYTQAVATSAPWENIEALIAETGIRPYFQAIVSAYERPGKPDPCVFLEAARQLGLPPQDCLVIEDSLVGVQAARRGGMNCLAVATSFPAEQLAGADWVLARLSSQNPREFIAHFDDK